jgi:very-short-patch-repair endonuclease
MTDAEAILWRSLRTRRFGRFKFRRQHPVGNYVLDFYCAEAKLAIELDGGQHAREDHSTPDKARTRDLEKRGIRVLRFWNNEVFQNLDGVMIRVAEALASSGADR